jgi:hypothetical protein
MSGQNLFNLEYLVEYEPASADSPSEQGAFIQLRIDLPIYLDRISKEKFFSSINAGLSIAEIVPTNGGGSTQSYNLAYVKPFAGTLFGYIYKRLGISPAPLTDTLIQTFNTDWNGIINLTTIGSPTEFATSGFVELTNDRIALTWNVSPINQYYLVANYDYAAGVLPVGSGFATGLFNLQGVVELAINSYRVWILKAPLYQWSEVLNNVIEYLRVSLGQNTTTALPGSGFTLNNSGQRRSKTEIQ